MLRAAIINAGLTVEDLWRAYVLLGGDAGQVEVEAYLHHTLYLPPRHRDSLVRATHQLVPTSSVPDSRDLRPEEYPPGL